MNGLTLSRKFYDTYGEPMLREQFPQVTPLIAVGLCGSGSECFGFDDEISQDHDFEPGFCLFIPDEEVIDRRTAFLLERAYSKLPKEFLGYQRNPLDPVGGNRHGVIRMADFFRDKTGSPDGTLSLFDFCRIPEQSLAEATNGEIFRDDAGIFSSIRVSLSYLPEDVRRKKLAGNLLLMGQAGEYNYPRCIARGETAAAQLAAVEFAKSALHAIFLLNHTYLPYYKWSFRALRSLPLLSGLADPLEYLISSGNVPGEVPQKTATIEEVTAAVIAQLRTQSLTQFPGDTAEGHAYSVNHHITDPTLRTQHVLFAV